MLLIITGIFTVLFNPDHGYNNNEERDYLDILGKAAAIEESILLQMEDTYGSLISRINMESERGRRHSKSIEIYKLTVENGVIVDSELREREMEGTEEDEQPMISPESFMGVGGFLVSRTASAIVNAKELKLYSSKQSDEIDGLSCYVIDYSIESFNNEGEEREGTIWIEKDSYRVLRNEINFSFNVLVASGSGYIRYDYFNDLAEMAVLQSVDVNINYRRVFRKGSFTLSIQNSEFNIMSYEEADY